MSSRSVIELLLPLSLGAESSPCEGLALTWEGHIEELRCPYLCVAGEAEELSPLEHAERLVAALKGPKQLIVYQDSRHSIGNVPSANLGPFPSVLVADWMADRLAGKPFPSERWYVEATGRVVRTPYQ